MISLDKTKCTGCRVCGTKCPFDAITFTGKYYTIILHFANQFPSTVKRQIPKAAVENLLRERKAAIAPRAEKHQQSRRGQLFEDLAELTDDDAAQIEMEDLDSLFGALFDDLE